jgi:hypothetical protein
LVRNPSLSLGILPSLSLLAAILSLALYFYMLCRLVFLSQTGGGWWFLIDKIRRNVPEFDSIVRCLEEDVRDLNPAERNSMLDKRLAELDEELDVHVVRFFVLRRVQIFILLVLCSAGSLASFSGLYLTSARIEASRGTDLPPHTATAAALQAFSSATLNFVTIGLDSRDSSAGKAVIMVEGFFVNCVLLFGIGVALGLDGSLLLVNPENVSKALRRLRA